MVMPGVGKMPLTGTEHVHERMGGHIVQFTTTGVAEGDPNEYHARTFLEWNPETDSYQMVSFSNMGEFTHCEMNWTDESTLTNFISSNWLGQSMLSRGVMKVMEDKILRRHPCDLLAWRTRCTCSTSTTCARTIDGLGPVTPGPSARRTPRCHRGVEEFGAGERIDSVGVKGEFAPKWGDF